jgi:hypothetical protein
MRVVILQIIVWPYPDTGAPPLVVETQHRAIIFGVQFLPQSNNARLISGGMDHSVQMHELPPADLGSAYAMQVSQIRVSQCRSHVFGSN